KRLTTVLGEQYMRAIKSIISSKKGAADLCAYFFLRAVQITRQPAGIGLIATNSISEGATRDIGLEQAIQQGARIVKANKDARWPGTAGVTISPTFLHKGNWEGPCVLNETIVSGISSYLIPETGESTPYPLGENEGVASTGTGLNGAGFILTEEQYRSMIERDHSSNEVIQSYLTAEDINQTIDSSPTRYVINFDDMSEEEARRYQEPFAHLERT